MAAPTLIDRSVRPSVSDQPAGHFDRSTVKPSGPLTVLPSADLPQPSCLARATMAARCSVHSASHSSIDVGCFTGSVLDVDPDPPPRTASLMPWSMVASLAVPPSSPLPQAAATNESPRRPAPTIRTRVLVIAPP